MITQDLDILTARFVDHWDDASVPAYFELQPAYEADLTAPWCRFVIRPGASVRLAGGRDNGYTKRIGRIWLQLFVPDHQGDAQAIEALDRFATIFCNWSHEGLVCETENMAAPSHDENGMVQYTINIPYSSVRLNPPTP